MAASVEALWEEILSSHKASVDGDGNLIAFLNECFTKPHYYLTDLKWQYLLRAFIEMDLDRKSVV